MKTRNLTTLSIGWIIVSLAPVHAAFGADTTAAGAGVQRAESLFGRVTNAATGRPLLGARVEVQGQDRVALTDGEGEYRFLGMSSGNVTLSVSYTLLDTAVIPVVIAPGAATHRDVGLTAEIYRLSKFVVSGEREGNAEAITLQKLSAGVRNIVSTDAFGSLAGNPADLLMRMPGVMAESVGGDRRYIRIRGLNENASRGFLNGGMAPYGYQRIKVKVGELEKAKLDVDPAHAPVAKRIERYGNLLFSF